MTAGQTTARAVSARLPWLDALRGAAALAVVAHHFYVIMLHGLAIDGSLRATLAIRIFMSIARWGSLGVPVFFVLSGFCVGQTWLRAASWSNFARRRFRRIFPAYYASLALIAGCALLVKGVTGTNDIAAVPQMTVTNALATISLFTTPASSTPAICWIYWSLTYEVAFYLLLTVIHMLPERSRLMAIAGASVAASMLTFLPRYAPRPGPLFFCDLWPLFGLGLALALAARSKPTAWIAGTAAVVGLVPVWLNPTYGGYIAAIVPAAILVWLIARGVPLRRVTFFEQVGEFSYSLYLTHVPVMLVIARWLVMNRQSPIGLFSGMLVVVLVQLAVAFCFYHAFERPSLRSQRPQPRRPAPASLN